MKTSRKEKRVTLNLVPFVSKLELVNLALMILTFHIFLICMYLLNHNCDSVFFFQHFTINTVNSLDKVISHRNQWGLLKLKVPSIQFLIN